MKKEDLWKKKINRASPEHWDSPEGNSIIPTSSYLERMERERGEYCAERARTLSFMQENYERNQQAILNRIQGSHQVPPLSSIKPVVDRKDRTSIFRFDLNTYMQPSPPTTAAREQPLPQCRARALRVDDLQDQTTLRLHKKAVLAAVNARFLGCSLSSNLSQEELDSYTSSSRTSSSVSSSTLDLRKPVELRELSNFQTSEPQPSRIPRLARLQSHMKAQTMAHSVTGVSKKEKSPISMTTRVNSITLDQEAKSLKAPSPQSECVDHRTAPKATVNLNRRPVVHEQPVNTAEVSMTEVPDIQDPEEALFDIFHLLKQEEWEQKVEGTKIVQSLAVHNPNILLPRLHDVCMAVADEVKNLRSMVARVAIMTLGHLFENLGRKMDQEVDWIVQTLLKKAGDSSHFIKQDVESVLSIMVSSCSPARVLRALLTDGLSHKNFAVRTCTAVHLKKLAVTLGASRLLNGKKELTSSFLTAISKLAMDPSQEVRLHARDALKYLATHNNFFKMVDKLLPGKEKVSIRDIISKAR